MPFVSDLVQDAYNELARRILSGDPVGLTTGLEEVDEALGGGFTRQQITYLLGHSGVGKSWLALSWIINGAWYLAGCGGKRPASGYTLTGKAVNDEVRQRIKDKENKPPIIVLWSLEMSELAMLTRMMSHLALRDLHVYLDSGKLMRGKLGVEKDTPEESMKLEALHDVYEELTGVLGQTIFMEFEARSLEDMQETLDALAVAYDVVLVVVDYFRLIDAASPDGGMASLQEERSKGLKNLARKYDCAVVSIFDANREAGGVGVPQRNKMRGGVAAEYDADWVLSLGFAEEEQDKDGKMTSQDPIKHEILEVQKSRSAGNARVDLEIDLSTGLVKLWNGRLSAQEKMQGGYNDGDGSEEGSGDESFLGELGRDRDD